MTDIFMKIVTMSISATILVLIVFVLRMLLVRTPKWINLLLWGLVAIRLICPFSFESSLSLMPKLEIENITVQEEQITPEHNFQPDVIVNSEGIENIDVTFTPADDNIDIKRGVDHSFVISLVWLAGIIVMSIYTVVSYLRVYRSVNTAVVFRDNIFQSDKIDTPFIFGIIKPRIYLPSNMNALDSKYVVAHEKAHQQRGDHIIKLIGFLILTLHWFNPMIWIAYIFFSRDIEFACDERAIKAFDRNQKADYSQALLNCSANRCSLTVCPISFGEVGVRTRVKSVLNYKKPAFWIIIVGVIACIAVVVFFLTDPAKKDNSEGANDENTFEMTVGVSADFDVPEAVLDYAKSVAIDRVKEYNDYGHSEGQLYATGVTYDIVEAKIDLLEYLGSALAEDSTYVDAYQLDLSLRPDKTDSQSVFMTSKTQLTDGWFRIREYLIVYRSSTPDGETIVPGGHTNIDFTNEQSPIDVILASYVAKMNSSEKIEFFVNIKSLLTDETQGDMVGALVFDRIEFITSDDQERIAQLGLGFNDMLNGYYILNESDETETLDLPQGTEFVFFDWKDQFKEYADGSDTYDRWISTTSIDVFEEYCNSYDPFPYKTPFKVTVEGSKITVTEIWVP